MTLTDEQRKKAAKALVETYLGFPAPDREPCDLDLEAVDAVITALSASIADTAGAMTREDWKELYNIAYDHDSFERFIETAKANIAEAAANVDQHEKRWVENRAAIIDVINAAGFELASNKNGWWLAKRPVADTAGAKADERELFETWALTEAGGWKKKDLERHFCDETQYVNCDAERDWEIWKVRAAIAAPPAPSVADDDFKNFHRLLCERFGYTHDEKGWKRDQLSLIEFIAAELEDAAGAPSVADAAGASEGQAVKPVAWLIDWPDEPELGHYFAEEPVDPMYGRSQPLYTHPSAEIAALRERIAGMEKAIEPFAEAFETIHAYSYKDADEKFVAFLDRNTVTPSMTVGDFRRLRDAVLAKEPK